MAKGGRSRYTKRPTPVVQRAPASSASSKTSSSATVASTAKTRTPAAKVTQSPSTIAPKTPTAMAPVATETKPATRPNQAGKQPTLSSVERWVSAFTRGFPYVLAEYCLFLLAVFGGRVIAIIVGAILIVLIAGNRALHGGLVARLPTSVVREAEILLGQRDDVLTSLGIIGVGLLCWALWNSNGVILFSWLSIVALVAALFLLFYAQRFPTPHEA